MAQGEDWTDKELEAAVDAYLNMLEMDQGGQTYNKAAINEELRQGLLSGRTKKAVEYRMMNISSALDELCLPWIQGFRPASHVGVNVMDRLRLILVSRGVVDIDLVEPTSDHALLETRTTHLRKQLGKAITRGTPRGQKNPQVTRSEAKRYVRDPLVKAWVLEASNGLCEACGTLAPFVTKDGLPFLETHHVKPLADGGPDVVTNAVAVCPNCHRRLHYASDRKAFTGQLIQRVERIQSR